MKEDSGPPEWNLIIATIPGAQRLAAESRRTADPFAVTATSMQASTGQAGSRRISA